MKKIMGLLVIAALALPMYAATTATAGGAIDLELREGLCGQAGSHCVTVPRDGATDPGARLIFTLPLVARGDGEKAGRSQGECVTLHRSSQAFFCDYNIYLGDGSVSMQGTLSLQFDDARTIPITGGTGAYEGATGTLRQHGRDVDMHIVVP